MHPTAKFHFTTVTARLRQQFPDEELAITHRLDLETSGVLLVARNKEAEVALKRAFFEKRVHKRYLAICRGVLEGEGVIDQPLGLAGGLVRVKMAVRTDGLPSRTRYRAVRVVGERTLVEAQPETGRQHQIRAHLDFIGHPVVGDKLYPDEAIFAEYQDHGYSSVAGRLEHERQALHAHELSFPHPLSGERVTVSSPLPDDLTDLIEAS
jgi:23S rRNA pseudouridine1911/1915/1917 synthase